MTVTIIKESHTDHSLTINLQEVLDANFADRDGFFIETIDLGEAVGQCALHGPAMGDMPVAEEVVGDCVYNGKRDGRDYESRLVTWPTRVSNLLTVIAGPHGDNNCVLYTAFAGPSAPKEPNDPSLTDEEREYSEIFWAEHALSDQGGLL